MFKSRGAVRGGYTITVSGGLRLLPKWGRQPRGVSGLEPSGDPRKREKPKRECARLVFGKWL